jgi:uncharacterized membrane protein YgdD (TMEM256/DUF423 family)
VLRTEESKMGTIKTAREMGFAHAVLFMFVRLTVAQAYKSLCRVTISCPMRVSYL